MCSISSPPFHDRHPSAAAADVFWLSLSQCQIAANLGGRTGGQGLDCHCYSCTYPLPEDLPALANGGDVDCMYHFFRLKPTLN